MSQAPASLLKELQNGYFFILSLYALRGRGSSPLGNITTFRLGGEGKRQITIQAADRKKMISEGRIKKRKSSKKSPFDPQNQDSVGSSRVRFSAIHYTGPREGKIRTTNTRHNQQS